MLTKNREQLEIIAKKRKIKTIDRQPESRIVRRQKKSYRPQTNPVLALA